LGLNAAPTRSINIVKTTTPLLDPTKQVAGVHSTSNGVHVRKTRSVQIRISLFYCSYKYDLSGYSVSGIKERNSFILYCVKCTSQAYCKNAVPYELSILPEKLPCIIRNCSNHLQGEAFFVVAYFCKCTSLISKRQELHSDLITVLRGLYFEVENFHNIFAHIQCLQHIYTGVSNT
jgi:hypothetical protein